MVDDGQVMSTQVEIVERVIDAVRDATNQLIYDSIYQQ